MTSIKMNNNNNHNHRASISDEMEDSEFMGFDKSISSIHCILEADNEDQGEEEEPAYQMQQIQQDEHSEIDSDREENDLIIVEDNEIIDSDNEQAAEEEEEEIEETENNEIDSDDENEIDSDNEMEMLKHAPLHQPILELATDDSSDEFEEDKLMGGDDTMSGTASLGFSNSEYGSFYTNEDATRSNSHSSAFLHADELIDVNIMPTIQPLKTGISERPTIEPLKYSVGATTTTSSNSSRSPKDKSPPRRQFRRASISKSDRGMGTQSERGMRTFGLPENHNPSDLSRSERGLRTLGADISSSERGLRSTITTDFLLAKSPKYRDLSPPNRAVVTEKSKLRQLSPPRIQAEGSNSNHTFNSETMSPPRHHVKRYDIKSAHPHIDDLSSSERGLRTIGLLNDDDDDGDGGDDEVEEDDDILDDRTASNSKRTLMNVEPPIVDATTVYHSPKKDSQSERGLRSFGLANMGRSERAMRTFGGLDMGRSERALRTFGADMGKSERALRTIGADMGRSERGLRSIGADMSRSERGFRTTGGAGGGPRRGPRRRHLVPVADSVDRNLTKSSSLRMLSPSTSPPPSRPESPQQTHTPMESEPTIARLVEPESKRQHQGEPDEEETKTKDKPTLNLLVSIQNNDNHDDAPFQDRQDDADDDNNKPQEDATSQLEQYPSPGRTTNYLEIFQNKIPGDSSFRHQHGVFKSVAARLFAERNKIYASAAQPDASTRSSLFQEPSTSRHWQLHLPKSLPEDDMELEKDAKSTPNETSAEPEYATFFIEELLQDYKALADRLKTLVALVRIYHQANQEWTSAKEKFWEDFNLLSQDEAKDNPTGANYEMDQTWKSRAQIREWLAKMKQPPNKEEAEENAVNDESSPSPTILAEDMVLQREEVLDYVIEWEDIVGTDVGQQIEILNKLKAERDRYDTKVNKLQGRMKWIVSQAKLDRNLTKQSTATQNYDVKESEVAFLLKQVTYFGWKDLYPLVEATMYEEWRRLNEEQQSSFGKCIPLAIAEIEKVLAEEDKKEQDRLSGVASKTLVCPMAAPLVSEGEPEGFDGSECRYHYEETLCIDPTKPLLVVDSRSPHGIVPWMTLLEHEQDPCHPALFDLQLTGCDDQDVEKKNLVDAAKLLKKYRLEESTPLLIHKGTILFGTLCLAEYMDLFWKDHFPTVTLHEPASVIPPNPLEEYNMNEFLQQHSMIESIWNDILMFWLEWHRDEKSGTKTKGDAYSKARLELQQQVQRLIVTVEEVDLAKFPGPYLCGHRFTLADIHFFAYWEHILVLLIMMKMIDHQHDHESKDSDSIHHYWVLGESKLQRLSTWYYKVSSRPSALAIASKAGSSLIDKDGNNQVDDASNRQFILKSRREYLIEHYNSIQPDTAPLAT